MLSLFNYRNSLNLFYTQSYPQAVRVIEDYLYAIP